MSSYAVLPHIGLMERYYTRHGVVELIPGKTFPALGAVQLYEQAAECFRHGDFASCETLCQSLLKADPNNPDGLHLLGALLCRAGHISASLTLVTQALAHRPNEAAFHNSLGVLLKEQGRFQDAIKTFRHAIQLDPALPDPHHNLGMLLLLLGDFELGRSENEWRLNSNEGQRKNALVPFAQPKWDGREFRGKTLLVQSEQGVGDTIQFARYLPLVKARGGRVVFLCQPELTSLFEGMAGFDELWPKTIDVLGQLTFDVQVPLLSIPALFATRGSTIPAKIPYVSANPNRKRSLHKSLAGKNKRQVGLVWSGNPTHGADHKRSIPLSAFEPFAHVKGVELHSLQKGTATEQLRQLPFGSHLTDWSTDISDFSDTAAIVDALDLVISVDTAVAHLAGALGKPVWILLPHIPDWRWMLQRTDSPWYPTARLFRQPAPGDWQSVIDSVKTELSKWASNTVSARRP